MSAIGAPLTTASEVRLYLLEAWKLALEAMRSGDVDGVRSWIDSGTRELERDLSPAILDRDLLNAGIGLAAGLARSTGLHEDRVLQNRLSDLYLKALGAQR